MRTSNYQHDWWPEVKTLVRDYYAGQCQDARVLEAIRLALDETGRKKTGVERKRLMALLYGKRSLTMVGAAIRIHISVETANRWHGEFIRTVAKFFKK